MRHYYLQIDTTVTPNNPGHGFCNSKKILAFDSLALLTEVEIDRYYDLTCKRVTRAKAMKNLETLYNGDNKGVDLITSWAAYKEWKQGLYHNILWLTLRECK